MFSETLVPKGGGHFYPPANSKTIDSTTTKLSTVIKRHIPTKHQQLDFPNFHCFIVCSYCSIVCLIIESGSKFQMLPMEMKIHRVDSPFNDDSKNTFVFAQ